MMSARYGADKAGMNGWQRLGVVLGTLLAIPVGLVTFGESQRVYVAHNPSSALADLQGQAWFNGVYQEARQKNTELGDCVAGTIEVERPSYSDSAYVMCDRRDSARLSMALLFAAIPYLILFLSGYAVAWVYRGFRPLPPPKDA
jgi:hypothetical protein